MDNEFVQSVVNILSQSLPEKIYLFGSQASGENGEDSDFDFFIIQKSDLPRHKRASQYRRKLFPYRYPIDLLVYTPEEVEREKNIVGTIPYQALREGVCLYG